VEEVLVVKAAAEGRDPVLVFFELFEKKIWKPSDQKNVYMMAHTARRVPRRPPTPVAGLEALDRRDVEACGGGSPSPSPDAEEGALTRRISTHPSTRFRRRGGGR